jgi:hypothetical protein
MLLHSLHRSVRVILWVLIICLTACSIPISLDGTPTVHPLASLATPTEADVKVYFPMIASAWCTVIINPGSINYDGSNVRPGSAICLSSGQYSKIQFNDLQGTAEKPITIRNHGGQVRVVGDNWVYLERCEHVHFTGAGTPGTEYGFYFPTILRIHDRSRHIEIDHIEITDRMDIKDDEHPNFEMTHIRIHHCYFHDSNNLGIYLGSSHYLYHPDEYLVRHVEIDHNHLENMAGKAIQTGSVVEDCLIHHNTIVNAVAEEEPYIQAAITVNAGCSAEVYANIIVECRGPGIYSHGDTPLPPNRIYNNLVINCGSEQEPGDAVLVQSHSVIYNNTIVGASRHGIHFGHPDLTGHSAFNNIVLDTSDNAISDDTGIGDIHHNLTKDNGYTVNTLGFVNPDNGDYHLTADSPAVDSGTAPPFLLNSDLDDTPRPIREYDVGAFEFGGTVIFP